MRFNLKTLRMVSNNLQKTYQDIIKNIATELVDPAEIAEMKHS